MKRLILLIVLVMLAYWILQAERRPASAPFGPPGHPPGPGRFFAESRDGNRNVRVKASKPVRRASEPAPQFDDGFVLASASDDDPPPPPAPPSPPGFQAPDLAREQAEGLPVPIVPGTRVTEAQAQPPAPPKGRTKIGKHPTSGRAQPVALPGNPPVVATVEGLISSDKPRAEQQARQKLREAVAAWLEPQVPRSWSAPEELVNSLVLDTQFDPIDKPYGTMWVARLQYDASPVRRATLVELYNRQLVRRRLFNLGGSLGFILICLAAVSGYIRADEATKGYYTNRLRMLAAAGVGAAGVIIYQMLA